MEYAITRNPQFDSLEITFDGKPVDAVRDAIKSLGFRWHKTKKLWYGYSTEDEVKSAIDGVDGAELSPESVQTTDKLVDRTKEIIPAFQKCIEDAWKGSQRMIDYCMKQVDVLVQLDNGMIIEVEKEPIEKSFCFGYSCSRYDTESFDAAGRMAHHAKTSEDYFREQNLQYLQSWIDELDGENDYTTFFYLLRKYNSQSEDNKLHSFCSCRFYTFLDSMGGSYNCDGIKGTFIRPLYFSTPLTPDMEIYIPTDKDLADIRQGYAVALEKRKKRVDQYLKKYGLKNVRTWTYWQDE